MLGEHLAWAYGSSRTQGLFLYDILNLSLMVPRLKSIICGFDTLTMIHVVALSDLTSFFRDYDMVDCKTDQRFLDLFGHSFRCKDTKKRTVIAG